MQPNSAVILETRDWLAKAALDLRAGEYVLLATPPLFEVVVFHAQQLAEKSLKAFLVWHDEPFRKTHDLTEIGQQCVALDPTLAQLSQRAEGLSDYAWKYRYPGDPRGLTIVEAQSALATARDVYQAILDRLPPDVRP